MSLAQCPGHPPLLIGANEEHVIMLEQSNGRYFFFGGGKTPKELFHVNSQPWCHSIKKTVFVMCVDTLSTNVMVRGKGITGTN